MKEYMANWISRLWLSDKGSTADSYVTTTSCRQIPGTGPLEYQSLADISPGQQAVHKGATHSTLGTEARYTRLSDVVFSGDAKDANGNRLYVLAILREPRRDSHDEVIPPWELITACPKTAQVAYHTTASLPPSSERFRYDDESSELLNRIVHFDPSSLLPGHPVALAKGARQSSTIVDLELELAPTTHAFRDENGDIVIGIHHCPGTDKLPAQWMLYTFPDTRDHYTSVGV